MPLIYGAVARGDLILTDYGVFAGNFAAVAKDYLSKAAPAGGTRASCTVDGHVFSFLSEDGYTYVVVADEAVGRAIPNAVLDRLKDDFKAKYGEKAKTVAEGGLGTYSKRLKELLEHATQFPEEYSRVASVQKKVAEVKGIMADNIDAVLSRGEKLDVLVDKTDNLMHEADRFVKSGKALRRRMWWNDCKMKVAIACAVLFVIFAIVLLFCFSANGGAQCIPGKHEAEAEDDFQDDLIPEQEPGPPVAGGGVRGARPKLDGATIGGSSAPVPVGRRLLMDVASIVLGRLIM